MVQCSNEVSDDVRCQVIEGLIERRKSIICLRRRYCVRLAGSQIVKGKGACCIRIDDDWRSTGEHNRHIRKWNVVVIPDGAADVVGSGLIYEEGNRIRSMS